MATINPVEVREALENLSVPADTDGIRRAAKAYGTSAEVGDAPDQLDDSNFETPADATEALDFVSR